MLLSFKAVPFFNSLTSVPARYFEEDQGLSHLANWTSCPLFLPVISAGYQLTIVGDLFRGLLWNMPRKLELLGVGNSDAGGMSDLFWIHFLGSSGPCEEGTSK
jgi:hypothetical protein